MPLPLRQLSAAKPSNINIYRLYKALEQLRSTGEREFPLQLAVTLCWIASHNGCLQEDLVEATSMSPSSVSRNVTWLGPRHRLGKEGLKFVRREKDPADPKRWRLYLTPEGKQFVRKLEADLTDSWQ